MSEITPEFKENSCANCEESTLQSWGGNVVYVCCDFAHLFKKKSIINEKLSGEQTNLS